MQLELVVKKSRNGGCPTSYTTDRPTEEIGEPTVAIQAWRLDDPDALATANLDPNEILGEVPESLILATADAIRARDPGTKT